MRREEAAPAQVVDFGIVGFGSRQLGHDRGGREGLVIGILLEGRRVLAPGLFPLREETILGLLGKARIRQVFVRYLGSQGNGHAQLVDFLGVGKLLGIAEGLAQGVAGFLDRFGRDFEIAGHAAELAPAEGVHHRRQGRGQIVARFQRTILGEEFGPEELADHAPVIGGGIAGIEIVAEPGDGILQILPEEGSVPGQGQEAPRHAFVVTAAFSGLGAGLGAGGLFVFVFSLSFGCRQRVLQPSGVQIDVPGGRVGGRIFARYRGGLVAPGAVGDPAARYRNPLDTVTAPGIGRRGGEDAFAVVDGNPHPGDALGGAVRCERSPIDHPAMDLPGPVGGPEEKQAGESRQITLHGTLRYPLKLG